MTSETIDRAASPGGASPASSDVAARGRHRVAAGLALTAILVLAAGLRLWRIGHNGFGLDYYAAGVRSMTGSWHNFFFNAFDPTGFVSLDKPPVAFWVQVAAAKLFGFSGPSILVPQMLEGTASVALLYHLVRRRFGAPAGLLAALFLALTPVAVAVDRSCNTDSCLLLVLLLAAWLVIGAAETGSWLMLFVGMAVLGIGFNVKMLAAFVVLPGFALVYLAGDPAAWRARLVQLAVGGAVLASVSLSWITAYDLTPPDERPYAGSSADNSMFELAVGHNGLERFVRHRHGGAEGDDATPPANAAPTARRGRAADHVPAGPLRLADRHLASQTGWLFPLAIIGLLAASPGLIGAPARDPRRLSLLLWSVWGATCIIVYSAAGGIFHAYYTLPLAAPLSALAGIGIVALWRRFRATESIALSLPLALVITVLWQAYIEYGYLGRADESAPGGDWRLWLYGVLIGGTLLGAAGLLVTHLRQGQDGRAAWRPLALSAVAVGLVSLLVTPAAWALSTVMERGNVGFPAADLMLLTPQADDARRNHGGSVWPIEEKLAAYLQTQLHGERYLLATSDARAAAPIIVHTGQPVLAMGGYSGNDPILVPDDLAKLVAAHQLRFVLLTAPLNLVGGREDLPSPLADWVRAHGRPIDPALWRPSPAEVEHVLDPAILGARRAGHRRSALYDLAPTSMLPAGATGG
jgi:4-amino-4-deoxy-L-arabinose transferase-like glycosyltransferase